MNPDIVDWIEIKPIDEGSKVIKLYCVVMMNYRQPLGDKAWQAIRKIFNNDSLFNAVVFLFGFLMGSPCIPKTEKFKDLLDEENI